MADVSVVCAVWSKDPGRHDLLRAHRENLRRQSVAVQPIYVFDNGDAPPAGLDAHTIISSADLSIYQAWNLGLAAVSSPLVMNLNLDDRLAPDGIEKLAEHLHKEDAQLAGGDWRICYSQAETDAVTRCVPASTLAYSDACPPAVEPGHRLGSGTGERATFGPATLWKMGVHTQVPRYPWRLTDGTLIRSVADGAFWAILSHMGARLARLPVIIGNYHSHPSEQAEYRYAESLSAVLQHLYKI